MRRAVLCFALIGLAVGCQSRLKYDTAFDIDAAAGRTCFIDGPSKDQTVAVQFTSAAEPVNVFVCLKKDEPAVAILAETGKAGPGVLGHAVKQTSGSLEVAIPAKQDFAVIVSTAGKKTSVSLKIVGK